MSVPLFVLCALYTGYTRQNETFRFQNLQKNTRSYAFRLIVFTSVKQSEIADIRLILTYNYPAFYTPCISSLYCFLSLCTVVPYHN
jgi:hypothetical protein